MDEIAHRRLDPKVEVKPCYFSQHVGIAFKLDDPIGLNPHIRQHLDENEGEEGFTTTNTEVVFSVVSTLFAHFMHMVYSHMPEGKKLRMDFDGIYAFEAEDEVSGSQRNFNAQLCMISEVDA